MVEFEGFGAFHEKDGSRLPFPSATISSDLARFKKERLEGGAKTKKRKQKHTAISNLTRIPARTPIAKLGKRRPHLLQALERRPPPGALIRRQQDLALLTRLGIPQQGPNGHNLILEPAGPLGPLGPGIALGRIAILGGALDGKVPGHVLRGLPHGLQAVERFLVLGDFGVEGLVEAVPPRGHGFGPDGQADVDAAEGDLVGHVLHRFEARGAEAVHGGGCGGVGEAGGEGGGPDGGGGFAVVDLGERCFLSCVCCWEWGGWIEKAFLTFPRQMSSTSWGSNRDFSMTFLRRV